MVGLWSVFTALTGLAWSFASLLLVRFLFGAAEAGAYPTCARAFYAWLPAGERGLAQGVNFSGSRLGAAFALPVVAWLMVAAGWQRAFIILESLACLGCGMVRMVRKHPEEHRGGRTERDSLESRGFATAAHAGLAGELFRSAVCCWQGPMLTLLRLTFSSASPVYSVPSRTIGWEALRQAARECPLWRRH